MRQKKNLYYNQLINLIMNRDNNTRGKRVSPCQYFMITSNNQTRLASTALESSWCQLGDTLVVVVGNLLRKSAELSNVNSGTITSHLSQMQAVCIHN